VSGGELTGQGIPMSSAQDMCLVRMLETQVGRMVVDRTGLEGYYNFTLQWTPDGNQNASSTFDRWLNYPQNGNSPAPDSAGSSIFTALQEQLGLELQSIVGTVPTIVIDHIEGPSWN
jgi:uncharacterized protein (TIGR03435 family)